MAKYEATSPVTLTAGATVASGLRGRGVKINAAGRAVLCAAATDLVIAVFSQDAMTSGEPVTVDQLQGKVNVQAGAAITRGHAVALTGTDGKFGSAADITGIADNGICVGVALDTVAVDGYAQILAAPIGASTT